MLVLRRKAGEAIVLNGSITIHVLAVEGERVKLGISAPPEVVIVRSELLENQDRTSTQEPQGAGLPQAPARQSSRTFHKTEGEPSGGTGDDDPQRGSRRAGATGPARYGHRARAYSESAVTSGSPTRYR